MSQGHLTTLAEGLVLAALAGTAAALPDGSVAIFGSAGAAAVAPTLARRAGDHVVRWADGVRSMLGRTEELSGEDPVDALSALAADDLGIQLVELATKSVRPPAIREAVEVAARLLAQAVTGAGNLDADLLTLQAMADLRVPHVAVMRQLKQNAFLIMSTEPYFMDGGGAADPQTTEASVPDLPHVAQAARLGEALGMDPALLPPLLAVLARHGLALGQSGSTWETSDQIFYRLSEFGENVLEVIEAAG